MEAQGRGPASGHPWSDVQHVPDLRRRRRHRHLRGGAAGRPRRRPPRRRHRRDRALRARSCHAEEPRQRPGPRRGALPHDAVEGARRPRCSGHQPPRPGHPRHRRGRRGRARAARRHHEGQQGGGRGVLRRLPQGDCPSARHEQVPDRHERVAGLSPDGDVADVSGFDCIDHSVLPRPEVPPDVRDLAGAAARAGPPGPGCSCQSSWGTSRQQARRQHPPGAACEGAQPHDAAEGGVRASAQKHQPRDQGPPGAAHGDDQRFHGGHHGPARAVRGRHVHAGDGIGAGGAAAGAAPGHGRPEPRGGGRAGEPAVAARQAAGRPAGGREEQRITAAVARGGGGAAAAGARPAAGSPGGAEVHGLGVAAGQCGPGPHPGTEAAAARR
mmetsp:Transcript_49347/g.132821  ORF Transcript_49347/g.132821 Transcript_49347/m.132821 type:complete len:384 (+) Transcript_49347:365-1516(+)